MSWAEGMASHERRTNLGIQNTHIQNLPLLIFLLMLLPGMHLSFVKSLNLIPPILIPKPHLRIGNGELEVYILNSSPSDLYNETLT